MPELVRKLADTATVPRHSGESKKSQLWFQLAVVSAIGLGILIRVVHVLSADFPLNDGGMFYAMVRDLQHAHYRLPDISSYNSLQLPFAYPPLGFYAAAILDDLTPLRLIDVFRFLPLAVTCLTLVAFFFLAQSLLRSKKTVVASVFAFAIIPSSFLWLIMGGGLTRSFGFLFAILALHQIHLLYTRHEWRYVLTSVLFCGLTVLSHLGTAPFLAFSIVVFFLFHGRHRHGLVASIVVALGTVVITAPWWATIVGRHGWEPFMAARQSGGSILDMFSEFAQLRSFVVVVLRLTLGYTGEPLFPVLLTLALLGTLASLRSERYLLPVWWLSIFVLEARAAPLFVSLPVAMLAGVGLVDVVLPLVRSTKTPTTSPQAEANPAPDGRDTSRRRHAAIAVRWRPLLAMGILLGYSTLAALTPLKKSPSALVAEGRVLQSLSTDERAAMRWIAEKTPASSRFLVITGNGWETFNVWAWRVGSGWQDDRLSEWFPVLAKRVSVATVQGSEWLPNEEFDRRSAAYRDAQRCGNWNTSCLDAWSKETGITFTHLYIPKSPYVHINPDYQCCGHLLIGLAKDARYAIVYDGPGAAIYARR
jgi:hypothetical protein